MKTLCATLMTAALLLPASAFAADFVWATGSVKATRWIEADTAEVGTAEEGQRLEVLYTEGDRVRVRVKGATFGWIDAASTTDTDPNPASGLPDLPELKLGADGQLQLPQNLQIGGSGAGLKLDLGDE